MSKTSAIKGFGNKLPSRQDIDALNIEFATITCGNAWNGTKSWTKGKILTALGTLNAYMYSAAKELQIFSDIKPAMKIGGKYYKGFHQLVTQAAGRIIHSIKRFTLAHVCVIKQLKKYWKGANSSRTEVYEMQKILSNQFGLFTIEAEFTKGVRGKPARVCNFNFVKALLLYEHLESALLELYPKEWKDGELKPKFGEMPDHGGTISTLFYNVVFKGIKTYRRSDETCGTKDVKQEVIDLPVMVKGNRLVMTSELDWTVHRDEHGFYIWLTNQSLNLEPDAQGIYQLVAPDDDPSCIPDLDYARRQLERVANRIEDRCAFDESELAF